MLKINDVELELDLMDADIADKVEKAIKNIDEKEKNIKHEGIGLGDIIRQQCNLIFDFFNEVFGSGTDKKIFGDKTNYRECEDAFKQVIEYVAAETVNMQKSMTKYSPNRATRRKTK